MKEEVDECCLQAARSTQMFRVNRFDTHFVDDSYGHIDGDGIHLYRRIANGQSDVLCKELIKMLLHLFPLFFASCA